MSKETIDTYDTHVQDVTVLAEYGFDLDYVKGALRWCLAFNGIRFFGDLMQLCSEITGSERSDNFTHRTALVMWVLQESRVVGQLFKTNCLILWTHFGLALACDAFILMIEFGLAS